MRILKKSLDKCACPCYNNTVDFEMWLSLVERCVRDAEVASSNLVISTIKKGSVKLPFFMVGRMEMRTHIALAVE